MDLFSHSANIVVLMITIYVYKEALQGAPNGLISLYYLETQGVLHVLPVRLVYQSWWLRILLTFMFVLSTPSFPLSLSIQMFSQSLHLKLTGFLLSSLLVCLCLFYFYLRDFLVLQHFPHQLTEHKFYRKLWDSGNSLEKFKKTIQKLLCNHSTLAREMRYYGP